MAQLQTPLVLTSKTYRILPRPLTFPSDLHVQHFLMLWGSLKKDKTYKNIHIVPLKNRLIRCFILTLMFWNMYIYVKCLFCCFLTIAVTNWLADGHVQASVQREQIEQRWRQSGFIPYIQDFVQYIQSPLKRPSNSSKLTGQLEDLLWVVPDCRVVVVKAPCLSKSYSQWA